MQLFITEKPSLAGKLTEAMNNDTWTKKSKSSDNKVPINYYENKDGSKVIASCAGHVIQLCDPEKINPRYKKWIMADLPLDLGKKPTYEENPTHKNRCKLLKELLSKAESVVHVGDTDHEGQAVVDNVLDFYNYKGKVYRLWSDNETIDGFRRALQNLKDNADYRRFGYQARARGLADQILGFNLTRAYSLLHSTGKPLHIGRVKSPFLGLVVRRDEAHEKHQKSVYYALESKCTLSTGTSYPVLAGIKKDILIDGESLIYDEKARLLDKNQAEKLAKTVEESVPIPIATGELKRKNQHPPLGYNANNLQQDMNKFYGYAPKQTMEIAQSLYEQGVISYPRTDCQFLSDDQHNMASQILAYHEPYTDPQGNTLNPDPKLKSKVFDDEKVASAGHSAIVPASKLPSNATTEQTDLYELVSKNFHAQFLGNCETDELTLTATNDIAIFTINARKVIQQGFRDLLQGQESDLHPELFDLKENVSIVGLSIKALEKQTAPPPYYSVSALLNDVAQAGRLAKNEKIRNIFKERAKNEQGEQSGGLGTSATLAGIYDELVDKGYLEVKGKTVKSTLYARHLYSVLDPLLAYPDVTALWYERQQLINSEQDMLNFAEITQSKMIAPILDRLKQDYLTKHQNAVTCPDCKAGKLIKKTGKSKSGKTWSMFNCTDCNASYWGKKDNPDEPDLQAKRNYEKKEQD